MGSVWLVLKRKVNGVEVFTEMCVPVPARVMRTPGEELASCAAALYGADGQPARSHSVPCDSSSILVTSPKMFARSACNLHQLHFVEMSPSPSKITIA